LRFFFALQGVPSIPLPTRPWQGRGPSLSHQPEVSPQFSRVIFSAAGRSPPFLCLSFPAAFPANPCEFSALVEEVRILPSVRVFFATRSRFPPPMLFPPYSPILLNPPSSPFPGELHQGRPILAVVCVYFARDGVSNAPPPRVPSSACNFLLMSWPPVPRQHSVVVFRTRKVRAWPRSPRLSPFGYYGFPLTQYSLEMVRSV